MNRLRRIWCEEDGILSFEWTLILTLLTIGIVSGLTGARDAIIDELGDVAEAAQGIDQSFSLAAVNIDFNGVTVFTMNASFFTEDPTVDAVFTDCGRADFILGQPPSTDDDS